MNTIRRWCAISGPAILLIAWLAQQFYFDRWNGRLGRLNAAEAVWDIYRSNHYVFNAMRKEGDFGDAEQMSNVTRWQLRNLEVGAKRLEDVLLKEILVGARAEVMEAEDGGSGGADGAMDIRFKALQLALERTRGELTSKKEAAQRILWGLYFFGAALTLTGTLLREAIDSKPTAGASLTLRERLARTRARQGSSRRPVL